VVHDLHLDFNYSRCTWRNLLSGGLNEAPEADKATQSPMTPSRRAQQESQPMAQRRLGHITKFSSRKQTSRDSIEDVGVGRRSDSKAMATTIAKAKASNPQPRSHSHADSQSATAMWPDHQPCPDFFSRNFKISACMIQPSSHSHAANSEQPRPCSQSPVATATTIAKTTATATARHTKRQLKWKPRGENFAGAPEHGITMKKMMPLKQ
jgi:hypothetical protein